MNPIKENRQEILISDPVYTEYDLEDIRPIEFTKFALTEGALDAYCPICDEESVFHINGESYVTDEKNEEILEKGLITITANCTRDGDPNILGISTKCQGRLCFFSIKPKKNLSRLGSTHQKLR